MDMPYFPNSTPPREVARSLARQALKTTNERRRQTMIELARLYMDLAILDAGGAPARHFSSTGF